MSALVACPAVPVAELPAAALREYVPGPQSKHHLHQVKLEAFEGPLDLLLYLIRRHHLDIFDVPIAQICSLYADCLQDAQQLQRLSIDVAADFLGMAAELAQIKSKTLLPVEEGVQAEDEDEGDPRLELVRRLLEYQKFQEAAASLGERHRLGRDVFAAPAAPVSLPSTAPRLRQASVFSLYKAFNGALQRQQRIEPHRVVVEEMSVQKRMEGLVERLLVQPLLGFAALLAAAPRRLDLIVCFLAVLELTRMKLLRLVEDDEGQLLLQARFADRRAADAVLQQSSADFR